MEPEFYFQGDKASVYRQLLPELEALVEGVPYRVSILANAASALRQAFGFFWVGFYLAGDDETLHVGPFQGDVACMLIRKGRGVCGTAWATGETQVVPDVEQFPGHIACSSRSRSEIVVPLYTPDHSRIFGVLDIDSDRPAAFDDTDRHYLEQACAILARHWAAAR